MTFVQFIAVLLFFIQTMLWQFQVIEMPSFFGFFLLGMTAALFWNFKLEGLDG